MEVRTVNIVEGAIQGKVGAENLHADKIIHLVAGPFDRVLDGLHHQLRLLRCIVRHMCGFHIAQRLRIKSEGTRHIQRIAGLHRIAERQL